jgi:hypothetical protein
MSHALLHSKENLARYLSQLDTADRQPPSEALAIKSGQCAGIRTFRAALARSLDPR